MLKAVAGSALVLLLAGCASPAQTSTTHYVVGHMGHLAFGYAYGGTSFKLLQPDRVPPEPTTALDGPLVLKIDPTNNTAHLWARIHEASGCDAVDWSHAGGGTPLTGNGFGSKLALHGAKGPGGPALPKVEATWAGWGTANLSASGIFLDWLPESLSTWEAEWFLLEKGLRRDGTILKADGRTTYDPATPGDAAPAAGDPEATLIFKGRGPQGQGFVLPWSQLSGGAGSGPTHDQTFTIRPVPGGTRLKFEAQLYAADPEPGASFTLVVTDPQGQEVARKEVAYNPTHVPDSNWTTIDVPKGGDYHLRAHGTGTGYGWVFRSWLLMPEITIVMWWDGIQQGAAAAELVEETLAARGPRCEAKPGPPS